MCISSMVFVNCVMNIIYVLMIFPEGWREQYDPGTGRHYYWCMRTDRVAWLPPGHPKAKLTEAASQVSKEEFFLIAFMEF